MDSVNLSYDSFTEAKNFFTKDLIRVDKFLVTQGVKAQEHNDAADNNSGLSVK